jgi:AraC family transcriptional regulator, regulatory protein of adaptative response / DNA-3-methyladenine glycosylase II
VGPDLTERLPVRPPLEWDTVLRYLALRAIPGIEVVAGGVYRRTVVVDGAPGVIEVASGGDDQLLLRARPPQRDGLAEVARRVRGIFGLDTDLEAARAALAGDPVIGPLLAARPGLRVPGTWDPYEIGVRAIVGQQVTVAGASTLAGRLVERHGKRLSAPAAPGLTHTFPPPATLAGGDLDGIGLTGARAQAIGAFAAAVAADRVRLNRSVPLDQLVDAIAGIPGVGPWTAQYVALRMGQPDALPASDLGLRRALADPAAGSALPSAAEVSARACAWRPWRALAAVHLWTSGPAAAPA